LAGEERSGQALEHEFGAVHGEFSTVVEYDRYQTVESWK
jgi:hypothetical protein